jgi:CopG family transcriptional regulator/antitoxin EndoAI
MRSAKVISISLPPDMNEEIQEAAKEERRSVSEVFREALRQYLAMRTLGDARKQARKVAKRKKIRPEDVAEMVSRARR